MLSRHPGRVMRVWCVWYVSMWLVCLISSQCSVSFMKLRSAPFSFCRSCCWCNDDDDSDGNDWLACLLVLFCLFSLNELFLWCFRSVFPFSTCVLCLDMDWCRLLCHLKSEWLICCCNVCVYVFARAHVCVELVYFCVCLSLFSFCRNCYSKNYLCNPFALCILLIEK